MQFKRVNLSEELRADTDGMPVFRKCFPHEILMSFYDDAGCEGFCEWWYDGGNALFGEWLDENYPEYNWRKLQC